MKKRKKIKKHTEYTRNEQANKLD